MALRASPPSLQPFTPCSCAVSCRGLGWNSTAKVSRKSSSKVLLCIPLTIGYSIHHAISPCPAGLCAAGVQQQCFEGAAARDHHFTCVPHKPYPCAVSCRVVCWMCTAKVLRKAACMCFPCKQVMQPHKPCMYATSCRGGVGGVKQGRHQKAATRD